MNYSFFKKKKLKANSKSQEKQSLDESLNTPLSKSLDDNLNTIQELLDTPSDLVIRQVEMNENGKGCFIAFIDGLADKKTVNEMIIRNIQIFNNDPSFTEVTIQKISAKLLSVSEIKETKMMDDVSLALLSGDAVLFLEDSDVALIVGAKGYETRPVMEPVSEGVIRGPREGFVENLRTNTALIRRDIRDPNLRIKSYKVGRRSQSDVAVVYIEGIAHPDIVKEVERRLLSMDVDDVPESGYVEEFLQDSFLSPFPQVQNTERPDKVSTSLTEGRVAILLDGTPFVLLAPSVFMNFLQSPEDYFERWLPGSFLRALRYLTAFIAVFAPALYIALVSFHQGMIPSKLAFSIAATREGVPFPAVIEAFLMIITMEILQEAGSRLPKPIGQTVGIVGGLVIGEAAVSAGIVSPIMVIVVAMTAIATFTIPSYSFGMALRILRLIFMLAAASFGFYGLILIYIGINIHLVNLTSFGVPYTVPFAPSFYGDWKDLVFRMPHTVMKKRPIYTDSLDHKRMKGN